MTPDRPLPERTSLLSRIVRGEGVPVTPLRGYSLSVVFVGAVLIARLTFLPAPLGFISVSFLPSVALAAMLFGAGPGLAAVALSAVCTAYLYFYLPSAPVLSNSAAQLTALVIFAFSGSVICFFAYHMRRNAVMSRASSERFYLLASSAFEGIAMTEQGRFVDCNEQLLHMLGYSRAELIGMPVQEMIPVADRSAVMANIQTGAESHIEHDMICKDGRIIRVEAHGQTNRSDGRAIRITALHDITERKNAEVALRRESEKNRALLRNASDGIHILDSAGNIIEVSDAFCNMLGYSRDEMIGMNVSRWDAMLGDSELADAVRRQLMSGVRSQFEARHRRKDGTTFDVEVSGFALELDGQRVLFNSARDITERKISQERLAAREAQWRTLVENSRNTIARYDRSCRRIYVNPAFGRMVEGGAAALIGKTPSEFPGGSNSAAYEAKIQEVFATGQGSDFELNWKDTEGKDICSHIRLAAECDIYGNVATVMGVGSDITELNAQREMIHQMAFYDHLTDLPNRRLLQDRLQQALASSTRSGKHGALLFIDLDDFKSLNDTLGHATGDALLQQVAARLKTNLREGDSIARMGGDEFVVILEGLSEQLVAAAQQTEGISNKIFAALNRPYRLAFHEYHCTASIGATLFSGHDQAKAELIKQADIAMYQAKKAGRSNLRFFDPAMQDVINAQAALEAELRQAIERRQFDLHYQVQVDRANRVFGAEALIRWNHSVRGLVSPSQFIPLAERTDLILPIGQWVLETACAQLKVWEDDVLCRRLSLSVNVSARQFHRKTFVDSVRDTVQRHAINPALLTLEITESLLLEHIEDTIGTMSALRRLGVRFSLDDFGTGYSSLQYLKRLPLNQLKIDRSFVSDIAVDVNDLAIVQTIIAMAQSLNLGVIAEGVETQEGRQLLLGKGCEQFQGYLFGKPVAIGQFDEALKACELLTN
jgi:diguanylate cyclase (GGDEF)-like protein/PAS domain S-box-containing protein